MNKANRVVLFDLGGVLADFGEPAKTIVAGKLEGG